MLPLQWHWAWGAKMSGNSPKDFVGTGIVTMNQSQFSQRNSYIHGVKTAKPLPYLVEQIWVGL